MILNNSALFACQKYMHKEDQIYSIYELLNLSFSITYIWPQIQTIKLIIIHFDWSWSWESTYIYTHSTVHVARLTFSGSKHVMINLKIIIFKAGIEIEDLTLSCGHVKGANIAKSIGAACSFLLNQRQQ